MASQLASSRVSDQRERLRNKLQRLLRPKSQKSYPVTSAMFSLLEVNHSLGHAHTQGEELCHLKGDVSKILWIYLKRR